MNKHTEQNKAEDENPENSAAQDKEILIKESEYAKIVEEAASFKDKYVRILAEFDNARKRHERDRADLIK